MKDFEEFQLCNADPDDISDVLLKVEKSFGFRFGKTEISEVKTFGELCDLITNKVSGYPSDDCTTQQSFHKVRDALSFVLDLDKKEIRPGTDLQLILPRHIRRKKMKEIDDFLGFKTKVLDPNEKVSLSFIIILLGSFILLFSFWKIGLTGLLAASLGLHFTFRFANHLTVKTAGELADKLSREHYMQSRRIPSSANKNEITRKVKDLFIADLGMEELQLTREASFI
jgi:acyl carrier protein